MITAIIAAAGQGKRMGANGNKVFLTLFGQPLLLHSVQRFSDCQAVDNLVVVAAADERAEVEAMLTQMPGIKPWQVVAGGSERQYSINNALQAVPQQTKIILVHDGARPLITAAVIERVIKGAQTEQAAIAAVPVKDTIKSADSSGYVRETPPRHTLWSVQTPQGFSADVLRKAYDKAQTEGYLGTDDASLVEKLGIPVKFVEGSYENIKITTPEDMVMAQALQKGMDTVLRVGNGYDVHKLVTGRKLILGGVEVPYELGLDGHSDADVLLHAIKDALLGAAALGDIGRHFPDTDMKYKGASSIKLLEAVRDIIAERGYRVNNVDSTIVAQRPKLAPYIAQMNANIAAALQVEPDAINVKATTTEGLGFAGKGKGIAAYAAATIIKIN